MEEMTTTIPVSELKRLISSMVHQEVPVLIRYRTLGQLWYPNFLQVLEVRENKRILFHDESRNKLISLPDVSLIIQFELDGRFYPFEPNCHYQVSEHLLNDQ